MKKGFTFLASVLATSASFAQITINSADVPTPTGKIPLLVISPSGQTAIGTNQTWNYGSFAPTGNDTMPYVVETNPTFTAAGIDVSLAGSKSFNSNFVFYCNRELDYNATGIVDKGLFVPQQTYGLGNFTGNNNDSLRIPQQAYVLSSPSVNIQLPMTMSSAWSSISSRAVNFTLTVAAASLNNTPSQHRYQLVRKDSIVAWGKLSVHTATGTSIPYDVLVDKLQQYAIDSFFVGGAPAPAQLQAAFSVTQGQITDKQYAYHFYRKGTPMYMMRLTYGADNTYTTLAGAYVNANGLTTLGIKESEISYTSVVFPNPANGSKINIQLIGKTLDGATYQLTDLAGRTVALGTPATTGNNFFQVALPAQLPNGSYFISLYDKTHHAVAQEKILVQR